MLSAALAVLAAFYWNIRHKQAREAAYAAGERATYQRQRSGLTRVAQDSQDWQERVVGSLGVLPSPAIFVQYPGKKQLALAKQVRLT